MARFISHSHCSLLLSFQQLSDTQDNHNLNSTTYNIKKIPATFSVSRLMDSFSSRCLQDKHCVLGEALPTYVITRQTLRRKSSTFTLLNASFGGQCERPGESAHNISHIHLLSLLCSSLNYAKINAINAPTSKHSPLCRRLRHVLINYQIVDSNALFLSCGCYHHR